MYIHAHGYICDFGPEKRKVCRTQCPGSGLRGSTTSTGNGDGRFRSTSTVGKTRVWHIVWLDGHFVSIQ